MNLNRQSDRLEDTLPLCAGAPPDERLTALSKDPGFIHSDRPLSGRKSSNRKRPGQNVRRDLPCKFFEKGLCKKGNDCRFKHSIPIVPPVVAADDEASSVPIDAVGDDTPDHEEIVDDTNQKKTKDPDAIYKRETLVRAINIMDNPLTAALNTIRNVGNVDNDEVDEVVKDVEKLSNHFTGKAGQIRKIKESQLDHIKHESATMEIAKQLGNCTQLVGKYHFSEMMAASTLKSAGYTKKIVGNTVDTVKRQVYSAAVLPVNLSCAAMSKIAAGGDWFIESALRVSAGGSFFHKDPDLPWDDPIGPEPPVEAIYDEPLIMQKAEEGPIHGPNYGYLPDELDRGVLSTHPSNIYSNAMDNLLAYFPRSDRGIKIYPRLYSFDARYEIANQIHKYLLAGVTTVPISVFGIKRDSMFVDVSDFISALT